MNNLQKVVTQIGAGRPRISRRKKILLIGGGKSAASLNGQEAYRLFQCDTVRQAWNLVYRHRPHLIVFDLGTAQSAGLSALRECRALAGPVPIIVAAPEPLTRPLAAALEQQVMAVIPASSIARGVGKVLQRLV